MNTADLRLFEAVALHSSFTKAAASMFTVQSNVTARIKNLEEEFGASLFVRSSRKVELTSAGKTLLNYSKKINQLVEEARLQIGKSDTIAGELRIGFIETTMALRGPAIVTALADHYPAINLDLTSAMPDVLFREVLNYKLDAAFIPAPIHHPELEQVPILQEHLVAVTPGRFKSLEDVVQEQQLKAIVFDQGCFFRARMESWMTKKGLMHYHKTVMNSIEGVVNFVESGLGFSFLPTELVSTFYAKRKINSFPLPTAIRNIKTNLVYRKDNMSSPVLKAFISVLADKRTGSKLFQ